MTFYHPVYLTCIMFSDALGLISGAESKLPGHPTIVEAFGEYTDVTDITLREVEKHFPVDDDAIQWKANLDHQHRVADCTKFHDAWRANVKQTPIISGASNTVLT